MTTMHAPDSIGTRLATIAARLPDKIALVDGETEIDFRQLDAAATAIARRIVMATHNRSGPVCPSPDRSDALLIGSTLHVE